MLGAPKKTRNPKIAGYNDLLRPIEASSGELPARSLQGSHSYKRRSPKQISTD